MDTQKTSDRCAQFRRAPLVLVDELLQVLDQFPTEAQLREQLDGYVQEMNSATEKQRRREAKRDAARQELIKLKLAGVELDAKQEKRLESLGPPRIVGLSNDAKRAICEQIESLRDVVVSLLQQEAGDRNWELLSELPAALERVGKWPVGSQVAIQNVRAVLQPFHVALLTQQKLQHGNVPANETVEHLEHLEQPKTLFPTNPDVAEVLNAVRQSTDPRPNVSALCRKVAQKSGANPESLRVQYNRYVRKHAKRQN